MGKVSIREQLTQLPEPLMLGINAAIGGFVLVAHGGALLLVLSGKLPTRSASDAFVHNVIPFTLPVAFLVVASSVVGFLRTTLRKHVLLFQGVVLFLAGMALLGWAASLVLNGIPSGHFSWVPGVLTGWVAYSSFLVSRFSVRSAWQRYAVVRHLPIICMIVALSVDLGVMARFMAKMVFS